jgi:putative transposase
MTSFTLGQNIIMMILLSERERRSSMGEEIRKEAILRYIVDKEKPKTIYTSIARTKPWFFKWLKRYFTGDSKWYKDQSRAPLRKPTEISKGERDLIVDTRRRLESESYAQIGVSAIKWELKKLGVSFPI